VSTSTLRPNSTSTFDGTIAGGAGSAHAALSDDNDLTGITLDPPSGATPGEGWIGGFTDLTLPAGAVIGYVGLRVRASDLDGGDLAYYQVRVFTDAQYGDAAFNPLTSTATAESGIVNSTGTRYRVPDTLVDDTYRAYVRIAQDIPGVGLHWSDFDTVDFTIDVDLPADPTISATADSANGRFSLAVAAVAGIATTDRLEVERSFDAGVTWEPVRTT
jgi:hypothetical protein